MAKLGCSLKDAFGESWNAGPTYYQAQPERFRVMDPYSSNVFSSSPQEIQENKESFKQNFENETREKDNRIKALEDKVERMTASRENFSIPLPGPIPTERIDNVVRFALVSILVSNFIDLMTSSSN